jgi:hypothetical protein
MPARLRFIPAGFIAFLVLTLLCFVYYHIPVHGDSQTGATDYVWEAHAYYNKMTEGIGYGRMNNEGFNNLQDFNGQNIDILLMGSSQMEGTNVPQTRASAVLLNYFLKENKFAYNIGMSGHNFIHSASNLETAVRRYKPRDYVVIETMSIMFDAKSLDDVLENTVKRIPSYEHGLIYFLQKIPYLRLLYFQYKNIRGQTEDDELVKVASPMNKNIYTQKLNAVMARLRQISEDNNVKPLIFYHPRLILNKDGSASADTSGEYLDVFKNACAANGVSFIDMTEVFINAYNTRHILPHGFLNTAVGAGHLNKNGHAMIAAELFSHIQGGLGL